jgi:phosphate transport system substrate-binding protein
MHLSEAANLSEKAGPLQGGAFPKVVTVETEAFGEALPMGCDDTEWGRQMNRRVELWVSQ